MLAFFTNARQINHIVRTGAEHLVVVQAPYGQVPVNARAGGFGGMVGPQRGGKLMQWPVRVERDPSGGDVSAIGSGTKLLRSEPGEEVQEGIIDVVDLANVDRLKRLSVGGFQRTEQLRKGGLADDGYTLFACQLCLPTHGVRVRGDEDCARAFHPANVEAGSRCALRPHLAGEVKGSGERHAVAGLQGETCLHVTGGRTFHQGGCDRSIYSQRTTDGQQGCALTVRDHPVGPGLNDELTDEFLIDRIHIVGA